MWGRILFVVAAVGFSGVAAGAKSSATNDELSRLAAQAIGADAVAADRAIAELRARGPAGLEPLLAMLRASVSEPPRTNVAPTKASQTIDGETPRGVIDRVAGQRYGHISRLYWYTDIEAAKAAAQVNGKPIISLRMLGNLTDEFSCANSRFFRTTLYANREIARRLGEHFVMHWQSVRPVPRVTIDFGDGRKLERTITGNSAHYALAADGTPLDVLPGLYGPQQFLAWLDDVERLHGQIARLLPADRATYLSHYHAGRALEISRRWADDLKAVAPQMAMGEFIDANALTKATTDEEWKKIALLPRHLVALDGSSQSIISRENPGAVRAGNLAVTKRAAEFPILALVVDLQTSIAEDGVRNEYGLHRQAHEWFAAGSAPEDVERLNDRVYAELFLMPPSDPWLGLAPTDTYTALDGGGVAAGR